MKKIFIFLLYVLLMPVSVSAQVLVTGTILDDGNEELPAVIIKCYAPGHRMRAYATSKEDGAFSISAVEGDSLNFSMLGYKSQNLVVRSGMKPLTVKMSNAAVQLKEVTVKSDRLHDRGDTTTYIVGAYANGNDRSIGDVIAKIPGFSIEKSTGGSAMREGLSAISILKD